MYIARLKNDLINWFKNRRFVPRKKGEISNVRCDWKVTEYAGEYIAPTLENPNPFNIIINEHEAKNFVVNNGRDNVIAQLFGLTWGASGTPVVAMGVGASSDSSTLPTAVTPTRLSYEYLGNASRRVLTNTDSETLLGLADRNDIASEDITISGYQFFRKIIVQSVYGPSDGNNTQVFREYGLFTTTTNPATPSSTSGIMFNRFVDPDPITKSGANTVVVQVTIRL